MPTTHHPPARHPAHDRPPHRLARLALPTLAAVLLGACASTTVTLSPTPQPPVCDPSAAALVLWAPAWRADQKDVPAREAAAADGLARFFAGAGCFARTELRRLPGLDAAALAAARDAAARERFDTVLTVEVQELGPVLRLLSSPALVDGGTEVVLRVGVLPVAAGLPPRSFSVRRTHGGPGVVQGVAGLPDDLGATLQAALQPPAPPPPRRD